MTNVLFICLHNAGRSQMSQALFERWAPPTYQARSAGTEPAQRVHPEVLRAMGELGIDLSERRPQLLTHELLEQADAVVTMGCGDKFQYVPGRRYVDWELPDPAGRSIEEVREIRDDISTRVIDLVSELALPPDLLFGEAFGLLDEGVLVVSRDGVVTSVNPAACSLLGRTESELRAPNYVLELDVRTKDGVAVPRQRSFGSRVLATGDPARDVIVSAAKHDGSRIWLSLNYQPVISKAGEVDGLVVSMRRYVADARREARSTALPATASEPPLTNREREVISLLALGYGTEEIAKELNISGATVRTHINHAMTKTGVHTRTHLVALTLWAERASPAGTER